MKKYWVYVHTCNANGKRYVGITTAPKPEIRWGKNGEGYKGQLFGKAVRKHGWSSITHEVFEVESEEEMYRKEIELISFYHSNDPEYGYNCSTGGEKSASGCTRSEEYRKKMSETKKGQHHSEESRKKMSEVHKEKWLDPEYREKISKALKGKPNPHSEEHKRHIAEAKKGKPCSEETRKKISETINKRNSDPEFRRKMSEAQKKVHSDPEYRKHMSEVMKGKPHKPLSEETKRRMSEARKGKPQPKIKIQLPDGTILEMTKQNLARDYVNKGRKFEYVS